MPTTVRPPLGPTKRTSPGQTDVLSIFTDTRSPTSKLTAAGCDPLGGPKELFAAEALRLRPPPCSRRFSLFALPRTWCAGMAGGRAGRAASTGFNGLRLNVHGACRLIRGSPDGIPAGIVLRGSPMALAWAHERYESFRCHPYANEDRVVRAYVGVFMEKMLAELDGGGAKGVEHVFRNLALFLSPPVAALDGGGQPLSDLRNALPDGGEAYDALGLDGARLADALLGALPWRGASAHDPGRVLVAGPGAPAAQVDRALAAVGPLGAYKRR